MLHSCTADNPATVVVRYIVIRYQNARSEVKSCEREVKFIVCRYYLCLHKECERTY